jgi:hypothetical protein
MITTIINKLKRRENVMPEENEVVEESQDAPNAMQLVPDEGTYFNNAITAELQKVIASYAAVGVKIVDVVFSAEPKPEIAVYCTK